MLKHPQDASSLWDRAAEECCICLGREVEKCSNVSDCFAVDPGQSRDTAELHVNIQYRLNTCTQIASPTAECYTGAGLYVTANVLKRFHCMPVLRAESRHRGFK